MKKLNWILTIRRAVFTECNRSLAPGSIALLAPNYKQGLEKMYASLARVTRFIEEDNGASTKKPQGAWMTIANPWDEEETIEAAVENLPQKPTRDKVQRMTRGSQYKICNRKL